MCCFWPFLLNNSKDLPNFCMIIEDNRAHHLSQTFSEKVHNGERIYGGGVQTFLISHLPYSGQNWQKILDIMHHISKNKKFKYLLQAILEPILRYL